MIFVLSFWPHVVFYGKIHFAFLIIIFRRINELNRLNNHYNPSLSFFLNHTILKSKRNTNNKQKHNIVATYTFISNYYTNLKSFGADSCRTKSMLDCSFPDLVGVENGVAALVHVPSL